MHADFTKEHVQWRVRDFQSQGANIKVGREPTYYFANFPPKLREN